MKKLISVTCASARLIQAFGIGGILKAKATLFTQGLRKGALFRISHKPFILAIARVNFNVFALIWLIIRHSAPCWLILAIVGFPVNGKTIGQLPDSYDLLPRTRICLQDPIQLREGPHVGFILQCADSRRYWKLVNMDRIDEARELLTTPNWSNYAR